MNQIKREGNVIKVNFNYDGRIEALNDADEHRLPETLNDMCVGVVIGMVGYFIIDTFMEWL